jgi:hypothetical protein
MKLLSLLFTAIYICIYISIYIYISRKSQLMKIEEED